MEEKPEPEWVEAMPLAVLEQAGRKIFKAGGKQIALFHEDGQVHACNNRCPHEGYPLIEGTVDQAGGHLPAHLQLAQLEIRSGQRRQPGRRRPSADLPHPDQRRRRLCRYCRCPGGRADRNRAR